METTQTFTGTVAVQSSSFSTFNVSRTSEVDMTLVSVGPPSVVVGLGIGSVNGNSCSVFSSKNVEAGSSAQLTAQVVAGTYCASVFDVGNLTGSTPYTLNVTHF